jgi:[ribosomal protein S5]-alanine N-acetyltransferase
MVIMVRKLRQDDLGRLYSLFCNDKILDNMLIEKTEKTLSLSDEKKWIRSELKNYGLKKPKNYVMAITFDGAIIGCIGAANIDYKNMKCEIGYWIGKDYWGKGYCVNAIRDFTAFLFERFKFNRIEAHPFAFNKRSQRVLEKSGFKLEGKRRNSIIKFGILLDDMVYAKIRNDVVTNK